jgi:hypothetical protein
MMDLAFPVTWIPLGDESYPKQLHHAKDGAPDEFELTDVTLRQILSASNEKEAAWMEVGCEMPSNSSSLRRIYVETNARHVEIYTEGNYFATLIGVPLESSTKDEPAFCHKLSELIKFSKLRLKFLSIRNSSDDVLLKIQRLKLSDVKTLQNNLSGNVSTDQVPNFPANGMESSTAQLLSLIAQGQKPLQSVNGAQDNTKNQRQSPAIPPSDLIQMKGFLMGEVSHLLDAKLAPLYSRLDRLQSRVEELLSMQLRSEQQRCEDRNVKMSSPIEAQTPVVAHRSTQVAGDSVSGTPPANVTASASAARSGSGDVPVTVTAKSSEATNKDGGEKESPAAVIAAASDTKAIDPAAVIKFFTSIIEVKAPDAAAAAVSDKKVVEPAAVVVSKKREIKPVSVTESAAASDKKIAERVSVPVSKKREIKPVLVSDEKGVAPPAAVTRKVTPVAVAEVVAKAVVEVMEAEAPVVIPATIASETAPEVEVVEVAKSGKPKKKKNKNKAKADSAAVAVPTADTLPSSAEAVALSGENSTLVPSMDVATTATAKGAAKAKGKANAKAKESSDGPAAVAVAVAAPSEVPASDIPAVAVAEAVAPESGGALKDDMKDLMRLLRGLI